MVFDDSWCFMLVLVGSCWFLVVLVSIGVFWWFLVFLGVLGGSW